MKIFLRILLIIGIIIAILGIGFVGYGFYKKLKVEEKNPIATMEVEGFGTIKIELYPDMAPNTVTNFIRLANRGVYDGLTFHRVVPDFMIQGGDKAGNGTGTPKLSDLEDNVSEDIVKNYEVIPIDDSGYTVEGVKLSTERVQVIIKVNSGKSVPIKVGTTGSANDNVNITSMELSQDYVEITGPKEVLDSINEIYTENIDLSIITKDSNKEVALIFPDGIEKASISYVTVSIEVEETKENEENEVTRVFEVEYTTSGLASGLNMTASSNKVKIVLKGSKSKLDSISIENIVASIDLSSITEAGQYTETPAVNITGDVQGVEISSVESVIINITKEEISEGVFDETTTDEESTLVP